jgi:hypothetical protein
MEYDLQADCLLAQRHILNAINNVNMNVNTDMVLWRMREAHPLTFMDKYAYDCVARFLQSRRSPAERFFTNLRDIYFRGLENCNSILQATLRDLEIARQVLGPRFPNIGRSDAELHATEDQRGTKRRGSSAAGSAPTLVLASAYDSDEDADAATMVEDTFQSDPSVKRSRF